MAWSLTTNNNLMEENMNTKRLVISSIAVFIFIFIFEWLFHGMILADAYQATAQLWRTEADMQSHFYWMLLGQLLFAVMFCFIFTKGYQQKGLAEGARYGFYMALFISTTTLVMYAVTPYPGTLVTAWIIGGIVELVLAGMILAAIYRS